MSETILYLHGFLSAPQSKKAMATQVWLQEYDPDIAFVCPQLSSYPKTVLSQLEQLCEELKDRPLYLIGSSLGGFWATYLIERGVADKAVLVNPAVMPQSRFDEFVGRELSHYYTDEKIFLCRDDLCALEQADCRTIEQADKYWLMVQTGDETLDYRLAVEKYVQSEQLIEEGGSHAFDNYERWLPEILRFFRS